MKDETQAKHPLQPIVTDSQGTYRFKENAIVDFLLKEGPFDLNSLAKMEFSSEDREQFAQLIGYSVDGFCTLRYVSEVTKSRVNAAYEAHHRRTVGKE